jgi:hypothetical protein
VCTAARECKRAMITKVSVNMCKVCTAARECRRGSVGCIPGNMEVDSMLRLMSPSHATGEKLDLLIFMMKFHLLKHMTCFQVVVM